MNKKWEYRVVDLQIDIEDHEWGKNYPYLENKFNDLGEHGWELVSIDNTKAYFKRIVTGLGGGDI